MPKPRVQLFGHVKIIDANAEHIVTTEPVTLADARNVVKEQIELYKDLEPFDAHFVTFNMPSPNRVYDFRNHFWRVDLPAAA